MEESEEQQTDGFVRMDPQGPACGIRKKGTYPGDRTGQSVEAGAVVAFKSIKTVQHRHSDGQDYTITLYELSDGRGWLHDFKSKNPGVRSLERCRAVSSWALHLTPLRPSVPPFPLV